MGNLNVNPNTGASAPFYPVNEVKRPAETAASASQPIRLSQFLGHALQDLHQVTQQCPTPSEAPDFASANAQQAHQNALDFLSRFQNAH